MLRLLLSATAALACAVGGASAGTLQDVKDREVLTCGVNSGLIGFASRDARDQWTGFDVDFCRALAAAVLGDPTAVDFVETTNRTRFTLLLSGELDVLARNTTWSFATDVGVKVDFAGINYFDGQRFMVPKALGVSSPTELNGKRVCVQPDTKTAMNLNEYFARNNISYDPVPVESTAQAQTLYLEGECDVFTGDASELAAIRATFKAPGDHLLLNDVISKEPLGPVVRHGDDEWGDVVRWVLNALISAEELGVTSVNIDEMRESTDNPEIARLLGTDGTMGEMLGLDADWAVRAIRAGGNYGEIFARNIGETTPIGLSRGLNLQWTNGGLLYSPPFR
ncbi:amino acid ABC transporter substrate-binding protein [Mameliella sediminis]|uniref:amino acid ABC transporter substrate-binding protein n=1 Tax=Mameliella sediminis TaxID=2836866 RepID=UPI001C4846EB|nr:amino acid ABC transporter substrate-binding protein [Mameliella sediminis]MBY6113628.1 amino acid ABC transporter substrate-binding protein [Antarctobacter heliothermus]MBY6143024.1 amino acid ABC transporter substrate-binding protein [Mameliella alba]MBV7394925.1 amino acid ABC transporter substrate-binding protein [Mameliella sediminis]MBY6159879.1 amino acid ABC transporter substrate-binding protein [Mameliella alba]MBY6168350.1 amino acid ABC transporter substrate-binding protein [Mame